MTLVGLSQKVQLNPFLVAMNCGCHAFKVLGGTIFCSWRALRVQKCRSEMQLDNNGQVARPLEEDSAPILKTNNYMEEDLSITGSGREEDESDSDIDLQEFARALSEAAFLASQSKKQSTSKHSSSTVKTMGTKPGVNDPSMPGTSSYFHL